MTAWGGEKGCVRMDFFKSIGKVIGEAASIVGEKNRRAAYVNRIRTVIKCEERAAEKEYLALGRYYYNNLRDRNNPVTEAHCAELDQIEERMEKALSQLENFYSMEEQEAALEEPKEEVTLEDVESFDHDPMTIPAETAPEEAAPEIDAPAEPGANDDLPFEG